MSIEIKLNSGRVVDSHINKSSNRSVVIIQDTFLPSTHQGILSILDELKERYGLRKLFAEGAEGKVSDNIVFSLYQKKGSDELIKELNQGKIAVGEYQGGEAGESYR